MDGKNALGRRISLLNEPLEDEAAFGGARPHYQFSCRSSSSHSHSSNSSSSKWQVKDVTPPSPARLTSLAFRSARTYSYASSSSHTSSSSSSSSSSHSYPSTPDLIRSDSSDSSASAMNRSPSPTTPTFVDYSGGLPTSDISVSGGENGKVDDSAAAAVAAAAAAHFHPSPAFYSQTDPSSLAGYAPIAQQHASQYPFGPTHHAIAPQPPLQQHQQQQQQLHHQHQGPPSLSDAPSRSATTSSSKTAPKHPTKKNTYPCPLAKQYNCADHFTTSGHAARHAKKHTGKKDAFCPECNKAFTRKDNMEQHRRTHQNGRSSRNGESSAKRQKTAKRNSISGGPADGSQQGLHLQASLPTPVLDPSLPHSPTSSLGFPDFVPSLNTGMQPFPDSMLQPSFAVDPALMGLSSNNYPSSTGINALDTLAIAAARREQKNNMNNLI
jgi:hypothetical protein